ncbi:LAME_0E10726g1_1 [Lachancea meyersii CBS 8951]|uniref:LAME_0E10726g1_1 n=1 Tax=Lachancea meyersii CBS 8951 TaxID=1266667 RepID=A0A1G4JKS2_9SACH|nr:LAME_0E10726g1_1 [Lachancea meyersii CBS 8951]
MSSQVVDQIFDTGFYWFKKAESFNHRLIDKVKDLGSSSSHHRAVSYSQTPPQATTLYGIWNRPIGKIASAIGLSALAIVLWRYADVVLPQPAEHLEQDDRRCVLLFGHMRDPITRQIVMDLYRRGFVVFVCSGHGTSENDDQGLFHVQPQDLNNVVKYMHENSGVLASILVVPNSAYNPSGAFTTLSSNVVQAELEQNVFAHMKALTKFLPKLSQYPQIILMTPSLPLNYQIPLHSPEVFIAGLMDSFFKALTFEYPKLSIYLCHLGVLKIAGSSSNYKYLSVSGSNIGNSLLRPLYNLIVSQPSWWFGFWERLRGKQRFYGKWSRIGYSLGSWIPYTIFKYV